MIERLLQLLLGLPAAVALPLVFLLSAAETAAFVGLAVPGEIAVILGGVIASQGHVPLWAVLLAGTLGPIAGDSLGYRLGKHYNARKVTGRALKRWERAKAWIDEKGGPAVFFGRFAAFLRSIMPAAAGAAKMPYRKFMVYDVPACLLWGIGSVLLGYFAGENWKSIVHVAGYIAIAVFLALGFFLVRRLRKKQPA